MDASLSPAPALAPIMPLPASVSPIIAVDTPPWEIDFVQTPAPVRKAPAKPVPAKSARIEAERIPWGMVALTIATAVLLVFGSHAADPSGSRVMALSAGQPGD